MALCTRIYSHLLWLGRFFNQLEKIGVLGLLIGQRWFLILGAGRNL